MYCTGVLLSMYFARANAAIHIEHHSARQKIYVRCDKEVERVVCMYVEINKDKGQSWK